MRFENIRKRVSFTVICRFSFPFCRNNHGTAADAVPKPPSGGSHGPSDRRNLLRGERAMPGSSSPADPPSGTLRAP